MYKRITSMILLVAMVSVMLFGLSMVDAADIYAADQYVSVMSPPYKATGNGKTDDTAAIQKALSSGKNIYFPDGTYLVDAVAGLKPVSNQKIFLSTKAVIKAKPNSSSNYSIFNIYDRQNVSIEGGTIQGERYSHSGTSGEWGYGIGIKGGKNILIKNVTVKDCWGDGIYIGKGTSSSDNVQVLSSVSNGNRSNGIKVDMSPNTLVEGNTLKGNGTYGVWVNNTENVTVRANQMIENQWHGIRVLQSRNCTIVKNTLTANGQAGNNAYDNISLEYNSDSNIIQENTCRMGTLANKSRYGVNIAVNTNDNNQIKYNDLVSSGVSGDLNNAGTGTILTGNKLTADTTVTPPSTGGGTVTPPTTYGVSVKSAPYYAQGNGTADDTAAIQKALSSGSNVYIPDGTYLVDAVVGLKPVNNQKITLSANAVVKAKPNSAGSYNVFNIYDKSYVSIEGGTILGERYSHSGTSGEWGNGIGIRGGKNIVIKNVTVKDCWGDGIYVGKGSYTSENIQILNSICDGNRRQGISVVTCKGALIQGCTVRNTKGTEPQSGIDIEVNTGETVSDIKVDSCTAYNNAGDGILAYGGFATQNNVSITNCTAYNNGRTGIKVDVSPYSLVEGNTLKGNGTYGLWVNNTNNVTVRGNQMIENKWHGIRVLQSRNCTIAKNTLTANGQAQNNAYDNISLEYNSDSNIVQENICRMGTLTNKSRYGVNIAVSTDDNNQILYNDLVGAGVSGGLRNAGTGTILTGNKL